MPRLGSLSNSGRTPRPPGPDVETGQPLVQSLFKLLSPKGPTMILAATDTQAPGLSAARIRSRVSHSRNSTPTASRIAVDPYTTIGTAATNTP